MKRIVTIQDISCVGKCSLTVALPIISAMGVETAILPTAVLSTHTMFPAPTCADLTDEIEPISRHWVSQDLDFDAIYTGYLASGRQISLVSRFFQTFRREGTPVIVDPAMADNGKLYPAFSPDFPGQMRELCRQADILLPNITEASLLTGLPYREKYDRTYPEEILKALSQLGPRYTVLTGVSLTPGRLGVMGYDKEEDRFFRYDTEHLPIAYHGTGDVFASTVTGALMRGKSLEESLQIACDYVVETIRVTMENPDSRSYGVDFEATIPWLVNRLA